jgi:hypothetical protein
MFSQYHIKAILASKDPVIISKKEEMKKLIVKLLLIKPRGHHKRCKSK